jgi:hypothetical protein
MRTRRYLGSLVATALVATTAALVAPASPAAAATATKIVPFSGSSWLTTSPTQPGATAAGDSIYFSIDVVATDGSESPYYGTVKVQRRLDGSSSWTTIATSSYAGYSGSAKAVSNATYRAVYSGGSSSTTTWSPSTATRSLKVQRNLTINNLSGKKAGFKGVIKPKKATKITVFKKQGKKFKKFKSLRSNKSGRFTVVLPAPKRGKFFWKITFAGDRQFVTSTLKGYTYRRG